MLHGVSKFSILLHVIRFISWRFKFQTKIWNFFETNERKIWHRLVLFNVTLK
jgi:hypothetical protein